MAKINAAIYDDEKFILDREKLFKYILSDVDSSTDKLKEIGNMLNINSPYVDEYYINQEYLYYTISQIPDYDKYIQKLEEFEDFRDHQYVYQLLFKALNLGDLLYEQKKLNFM